MKNYIVLFILASSLFTISCNGTKNTQKTDSIYGTKWELDYISGPRIAFNGLYPDKKPQITFDKNTGQVSGTDSCNGYNAPFTLDGNSLTFGEPGPSTLRFCEGGGDKQFRQTIQRINRYSFDSDGKLNLLTGDVAMMRFKKVTGN